MLPAASCSAVLSYFFSPSSPLLLPFFSPSSPAREEFFWASIAGIFHPHPGKGGGSHPRAQTCWRSHPWGGSVPLGSSRWVQKAFFQGFFCAARDVTWCLVTGSPSLPFLFYFSLGFFPLPSFGYPFKYMMITFTLLINRKHWDKTGNYISLL